MSRDSSDGIVTRLRAGLSGFRILTDARNSYFSKTQKLAVGRTEPHIERVSEILTRRQSGRGLMLTCHHLVPTLKVKRFTRLLSYMPSCYG
jgi:hypothetical protein